jgi:beta-lactamase regulating signal transducer with metallopeptidase domain
MITQLMLYGLQVTALLAIAASAIERVAFWRGWARRGCWAAAMLLSVALPVVGVLHPAKPPEPSPRPAPTVTRQSQPLPAIQTAEQPLKTPSAPFDQPRAQPLPIQRILVTLWLSASTGVLALFVAVMIRMTFAARHWRAEQIEGQPVWITDSLGPAVYGFIRPVILLPEWLLHADGNERAVALAHERSHLKARDPALLLLGLTLVTLLPWNLPLWWLFRRLRFAIEVDCDARVLRGGINARDYGSALLAIGERGISAPLGAVALTEPASQLLQRIRIMTAEIAKPHKMAVLATLVVATMCIGVAARTPAPAIASSVDLPRKLPAEDHNSYPQFEALVRATYPQFFQGSGNAQPELVNLFLNPDGSLFKSTVEQIAPRPYITTSYAAFDTVGIDFEHRGPHALFRINGASGLPVDVIAWYFQTPSDPTRDIATVRSKARARFSGLLNSSEPVSVATVMMTDTGEIDGATVEPLDGRSVTSLATAAHFAALGYTSSQIGLLGVTAVRKGHFIDDPERKDLAVIYAWPRRPNETSTTFEVLNNGRLPARDDDRMVDRKIAEAYFPDLYTHPWDWPRADPWVLLDRQGKVLTTGRRVVNSGADVRLNVESLYPGIKTERWQVVVLNGPKGEEADVSFVWIAADSPVKDPAKADLSRQPDVLLYADISTEGKTIYSQMLALDFGSSGTTVAALRNPFGVVHLQLKVDEGDSGAAEIRIRAQKTPLPPNEAIPDAVATAWSPQSAPVRAIYGGSSEPQVIEVDGKKLTIVLHADRLKRSAPAHIV